MKYQISYKSEGFNFATPWMHEQSKNDFVHVLESIGITYDVAKREANIRICKVAFDPNDVKDIIAGKKDGYTFEDPKGLSKYSKLVDVLLEDGRIKTVIVLSSKTISESELSNILNTIGRKALCPVIAKVA